MNLPEPHRRVVTELVRCLPLNEVNWALTGSVAHRLQGIVLAEFDDVDVQTDAAGARAIAERFDDLITAPIRWSEAERIRSHFGRFEIFGVPVEVIGAAQTKDEKGEWLAPTDPADHRVMVRLDGDLVPVLSLDYEAGAYARLGRQDRVDLIRRHLAAARTPQ